MKLVVDSSVWIEIAFSGSLTDVCEKAMERAEIFVPTLVVFEVYRKMKSKIGESIALEVIGALSGYRSLELTREIALLAADLSLEHRLATADSIVLAHARVQDTTLLTLDNDFAGQTGVRVLRS